MSNNEFEGFEDLSKESIEVQLVEQVTKCRTCNWFWRPPPYGPYPSFDFSTDFPQELLDRTNQQFKDGEHARSLKGLSRGQAIVNPQILHGCRKAPLMTIGINPNLTGFWMGKNGARWTYPLFSNFRRYAYYYRHRTTHQESFPLDFIKQHVKEEGALRAKKAGRIKNVSREMAARKMSITIAYQDGEQETIKQEWTPEGHFVILFDRSLNNEVQFDGGEIIGGFIDLPEESPVELEQNVVGYYQRVIPILEQVSAYLRSQGEIPKLEMAEDVSQLDMVSCASPGWGDTYKIDKKEVVAQCVHANMWVIKQLIQTNPKVIVFSGRSAFQLFNEIFKPFITPPMWDDIDVYGLMKMTARDPHYLDIRSRIGDFEYHLKARIIVAPHFSYSDNFMPHARLSLEDWQKFSLKYPEAAEELKSEKRVSDPNRDNYLGIQVDGLSKFQEKYPTAMIILMQNLFNASEMIGQGIAQEILLKNVNFNAENRHLERSSGPCQFCVNEKWQFPEGCAYGKPQEPDYPTGVLSSVAKNVVDILLKESVSE